MLTVFFLIRLAEALMHKDFGRMISYIQKKSIACQVTTNGLWLNKSLIEKILNTAHGSRISVSVNAGTERVYNLVNNPTCKNAFKKVKSNVLMFYKLRTKTKSK